MTLKLNYRDTATFVRVGSGNYKNDKAVIEQANVPVIFIQNTGFLNNEFQENVDADAVCYPDFTNAFLISNDYRLEGMYVLAPLFGASSDEGWYKVINVTVNRNHLLDTDIDNVQLLLKKSTPIGNIS